MDSYARYVVALLDELGIDQAVVGGVSLGANVCLQVAVQAPERVPGLADRDARARMGRARGGRRVHARCSSASTTPRRWSGWWRRWPVGCRARPSPRSTAWSSMITAEPEEIAAVLHGMLVGPITPTYEARQAITAPVARDRAQDRLHPPLHRRRPPHPPAPARPAHRGPTPSSSCASPPTGSRPRSPSSSTTRGTTTPSPPTGLGGPSRPDPHRLTRHRPDPLALTASATRRPGVGILGQLGHARGRRPATTSSRLTRSSTLRRLARTATQTSWRCSAGAVVVGRLGAQAPDLGQGAVEGPHDVGHADVLGRPGQAVATLGPALARDDAGPAQLDEDRPQEPRREALDLGQGLGRGGLLPIGQGAAEPACRSRPWPECARTGFCLVRGAPRPAAALGPRRPAPDSPERSPRRARSGWTARVHYF